MNASICTEIVVTKPAFPQVSLTKTNTKTKQNKAGFLKAEREKQREMERASAQI